MAIFQDESKPVPGTTLPEKLSNAEAQHVASAIDLPQKPISYPGPEIDGRATTVTIYSVHLIAQEKIASLILPFINKAFEHAHVHDNTFPPSRKRLPSDTAFFDQIGNDPLSFLLILSWTDKPAEYISTLNLKRWHATGVRMVTDDDGRVRKAVFHRVGVPPPEDTIVWELGLLAVDPLLQRRGLAKYLLRQAEQESKRRFAALQQSDDGRHLKNLILYLNTLRGKSEKMYESLGYSCDEEASYEKGFMECRSPFVIVFMSKRLETDSEA